MVIVTLGLAASGFALIVTRSPIFKWARDFAESLGAIPGELASCYFCMGTWFAMGLTAVYSPDLLKGAWGVDWLVSAMAVTALAGLISGTISLLVNLQNWLKRA